MVQNSIALIQLTFSLSDFFPLKNNTWWAQEISSFYFRQNWHSCMLLIAEVLILKIKDNIP